MRIFIFCHILLYGISIAQSPEYINGMQDLLNRVDNPTGKPRGYPFHKIRGPKCLNSKIGVVGAGPSGVHMAWMLKKRGFHDVTILERNNYLGGKSKTLLFRGTHHLISTAFWNIDYEDTLVPLLQEFGLDQFGINPAGAWFPQNSAASTPTAIFNEIIEFLVQNFGATDINSALDLLLAAAERYTDLHQKWFGNYDFELMPRPHPYILHELRGSVRDVLLRHQLGPLIPFFALTFQINGYR